MTTITTDTATCTAISETGAITTTIATTTTFFTSGLYKQPFYTEHEIDMSKDYDDVHDHVRFNLDLMAELYSKDLGFSYESEEDKKEQVTNMFQEDISSNVTFYEPMIFNEDTAAECLLIPLIYKGRHLLSIPCNSSVDLKPRLDAYQLLAHFSIDKDSKFFGSRDTREYFASALLGKAVIDKLIRAIELLPSVTEGSIHNRR